MATLGGRLGGFGAAVALGLACVAGSCLAVCGGAASRREPPRTDKPAPAPTRVEFEVFAYGRVLGTVAPCGCTTEPLGGLPFAFGLMETETSPGTRVVVEPGSFLFPEPGGAQWPADAAAWVQAEQRAALLQSRFAALGDDLVSGIGPTDVASPTGLKALAEYRLPRVVANLEPIPGTIAAWPRHRLVELAAGGMTWKVGVTAVVDPDLAGPSGSLEGLGRPQPAAEALAGEVGRMRAAGAQFTVALAQGPRGFAESLATSVVGLDLVVVGQVDGVERQRTGGDVAKLGDTWVLEPGERLQTVSRLRLSIEGGLQAVPAPDTWTIEPSKATLRGELERVKERLAKFAGDAAADPAFLARLRGERTRLEAAIEGEPVGPAVAVFEQVKITCKLPPDETAAAALRAYDAAIATANRTRFEGVKPPPPNRGKPGFLGIDECESCHEEAVAFWKTTGHASAFATLVADNKQFDVDCVGCHVTGFRQPGGSEVVENVGLRDVQCEVCHGPGSIHAVEGDASRIALETTAEQCATQCHTPEHSDTFAYVPYLRDVLGPGHGEAAREQLGEGPTGHALRAAGLAAAGGACKKPAMGG